MATYAASCSAPDCWSRSPASGSSTVRSSTIEAVRVFVEDDGPLADRRQLVGAELGHGVLARLVGAALESQQGRFALGSGEDRALRTDRDVPFATEFGDRVAAAPVERQLVAGRDGPQLALGREHGQHVAAIGDLRRRWHVDALDERRERRVDALDRADARVVDECVAAVLEDVDLVRGGRDGRVELFDLTVQPAREQVFGVRHPDLAGMKLGVGDRVALVQHREPQRHSREHRDSRPRGDRLARAKPGGESAHVWSPPGRPSVGFVGWARSGCRAGHQPNMCR